MDLTEYVLELCTIAIKYLPPDVAVELITAMDHRLQDFEIWRGDFVDRYHRAPTPDEVIDGFCVERWPIGMVNQMRAELDRALGRARTAGTGFGETLQ